jgi:hypothetical protein
MPDSFDQDKRRPLEIRVLDRRDDGGVSENDAVAYNGLSADAFVLIRLLIDEPAIAVSFSSVEGWTGGPLSFEALFNVWLGLTSHLAKTKADPSQEALRLFAERVLNLMRLNVELQRLPADAALAERVLPDSAVS